MSTQILTAAVLFLALMPWRAFAQTPGSASPELDRFSIQAGAGPLLQSGGHNLSATLGFSPLSRLDLLVSVERLHLPFKRETFGDVFSLTRGGTLTAVSGEIRVSLRPPHRVSPYGFAGFGGGVSRPTVNAEFPTAVENDLVVLYFGGGLRVPLAGGLSIFGDARAMMALETEDSVMGVWPVRAGVAWRF